MAGKSFLPTLESSTPEESPASASGNAGIGNSATASLLSGMLPGLGGFLPTPELPSFNLPGLDDILPSFPVPEIPMPGLDPLGWLPDLPGLDDILPSFDPSMLGPLRANDDSMEQIQRVMEAEGMSGLLDMDGALDRMSAREELAGRFQVVGDDFEGERAGNQVTQEQFDEIARNWSDIRLGRTDLQLDTAGLSEADATAFRSGTMNDIADIMQTESGRGLIDSLAHAPGHGFLGLQDTTTTISRRNDALGNADPSNASGGGRFGESGFANYVPGVNTAPGSANIRSDVTLYHELTHAHHAVYNTWNGNTVTAATGGTTNDVNAGIKEAEYQAAGLGQYANNRYSENRYRAERRGIGAANVGERTTGSETDDNMTRRHTYSGFNPTGPGVGPATMPAAPPEESFWDRVYHAVSGNGAGGAGDAGRIGQSTEDDHDHH